MHYLFLSKSLIFDFFINSFFGIGFGVSMIPGLKNVTKYFPKKRVINLLVSAILGNLGSSFFNLIIKLLISYQTSNDNNMY